MVIIHFLPIEYYPPVTNFLDCVDSYDETVWVFTTSVPNGSRKEYSNKKTKIVRYAPPANEPALKRLLKYWIFNVSVLMHLVKTKPRKVLYYETYSAYPVWLYKKLFNRRVEVYIHCHEYFSLAWYKRSMKLLRYYHRKEIKLLYPAAKWISHTNNMRLELFQKDHPFLRSEQLKIFPNFPPAAWKNIAAKRETDKTIVRCVYVGALSLQATYIKEFCEWIGKQNGRFQLDIFSFNLHSDARIYLENLLSPWINFYANGIEYQDIPHVLPQYDTGVILYKPLSENFIYNAPNKLFEYLVCGLDVWFPEGMQGCYEYIRLDAYPKIVMIDFNALHDMNWEDIAGRKGLSESSTTFSCESASGPLLRELLIDENVGKSKSA